MITFKMVLDTRRAKSDGKFPIMFRITHERKTTNYSSGIAVEANHWNPTKTIITKQCHNSTELNTLLLNRFLKAQQIIARLEYSNTFSFDTFNGRFGHTDHPIPWQTDHLFCWQRDAADALAALTKILIYHFPISQVMFPYIVFYFFFISKNSGISQAMLTAGDGLSPQ